MAVAQDKSSETRTNVQVGVPFDVAIQTFLAAHVRIETRNGIANQGSDYSVTIKSGGFTVMPGAGLVSKAAGSPIVVRRVLPLTTDFTANDAFLRDRIANEFDMVTMRFQQFRDTISGAGGFGVPEAPTDGRAYVRQNASWVVQSGGGGGGGITHAPSDGRYYASRNGAWAAFESVVEAPKDGKTYGRKDGAWVEGVGGTVGQDAINSFVRPEQFGAKRDGTAGDRDGFNAAFANGGTVELTTGTYNLGGDVAVPLGKVFSARHNAQVTGGKLTAYGFDVATMPFTGHRHISVGDNSALTVEQYGGGQNFKNAALQVEQFENYQVGGGAFAFAQLIRGRKVGGSGHREGLHIEQTSNSSTSGEFVVGLMAAGSIDKGSGMVFGTNGYAQIMSGADASAQACGAEVNTDVRRSTVVGKVGLQVVDVNTSTGYGTTYDAGIIIGCQPGAARFQNGIVFGFQGGNAQSAVKPGGTLIVAQENSLTLRAGLDLEAIGNWSEAPILLRPNTKGIRFGTGAGGGEINSEAPSGGGKLVFVQGGVTQIRNASNQIIAGFGPTESYLMFFTGTTSILKRLVCGAPDSGGTGYRQIRIEN